MGAGKLPQLDSIQELGRFWSSHDLTDFEDQLQEVSEPVFKRQRTIPFHLPAFEAERVRRIAQTGGIAGAELVRKCVFEKIRGE